MARFALNESLRAALLLVFGTALYCSHHVTSLPVSTELTSNTPWEHPCIPDRDPGNIDYVVVLPSEGPDTILDRLTNKTRETVDHITYICQTMEAKFGDPEITNTTETKQLLGFPKVDSKDQNNSKNTNGAYKKQYQELSKVAVFLEQIHQDEVETDMKRELENLLFENLSQMCELRLVLYSGSVPVPGVALRSIMTTEERHPSSTFKRYERDFTAMVQYGRLLQTHLTQYEQIKAVGHLSLSGYRLPNYLMPFTLIHVWIAKNIGLC